MYDYAIKTSKKAYMPNSERQKQYLAIYDEITTTNDNLLLRIRYLATKRQADNIVAAMTQFHHRVSENATASYNRWRNSANDAGTVKHNTKRYQRMTNASTAVDYYIYLLEEEIDDVIFRTNEFLTDATFTGGQGPFWWILQMSMALAGLFAIIMCANMAYKMMVKREPLDVMKLFKPLAISIILCWWYPPADTGIGGGRSSWCALDFLSYIPNAIGSYTHDLYEAEAAQVEDRMADVQQLMYQLGDEASDPMSTIKAASNAVSTLLTQSSVQDVTVADAAAQDEKNIVKAEMTSTSAGLVMMIDKIIMLIALITFRIGWWGTIYCQQILLGMLTIFGPIQWAFSLLPK